MRVLSWTENERARLTNLVGQEVRAGLWANGRLRPLELAERR
jgi:hypothetical protein